MNTVNINGKIYSAPDNCVVSVKNNKVYFSGKLQENLNDWKEKNIEIIVEGDCKEVKADVGNITIKGSVEGNVNADMGNISIEGNVQGNVTTDMGNISAAHIAGNATTDCGNIGKSSFFNKIIKKYL